MDVTYIKNVLWLGSIQGAQFLLPFITVPYLTRVLKPEGYGLMIYALSIAGFLSVLCDYGFGWTATQAVAARRNDIEAVRRLFIIVTATKALIFFACLLVYGTLLLFVPYFHRHWDVYALALLATLGSVLLPVWLFQGLERMKHLAWLSLAGRAFSVAGIFLLVREPADVSLAVLLQASALPLSGFAAILLTLTWLGDSFVLPSWSDVIAQVREARFVFFSTLAVNLYTGAVIIIVGSLGGVTAAGYYGAADKCLTVAKSGFGVLGQAATPRVAYLAHHDREEGLRFINRLLFSLPIGMVASLCMLFLADPIVRLLFGKAFVTGVVPLFHILWPIPFILNLSTCFASLFMFNYGFRRQWSNMLMAACALSLTIFFAFHFIMPIERAAAIGVLMAESLILLVSVTYYARATIRRGAGLKHSPPGRLPQD